METKDETNQTQNHAQSMKESKKAIIALITFLVFFGIVPWYIKWANPNVKEAVDYEVTEVYDGDTVEIKTENQKKAHVRLIGIDAPELDQPYGPLARKKLLDLTLNKKVRIYEPKSDIFGRTMGHLRQANSPINKTEKTGEDIGLYLIKEGVAWEFISGPQEQKIYKEAENQAKSQKMGLWRDASPIAPWIHRKENKWIW